jgi:hypothetical protein
MSSQAYSKLLSVFFDNPSIETKMKKKNKTFPYKEGSIILAKKLKAQITNLAPPQMAFLNPNLQTHLSDFTSNLLGRSPKWPE